MQSIELMAGDLLMRKTHEEFHKKVPPTVVKVDGVETQMITIAPNSEYLDMDEVEPIPLTADFFEKNGWEKRQIGNATVYFIPKIVVYLTKSYNDGFSIGVLLNDKMLNLLRIQFVHELQHALRLGVYSPNDLVSLADNLKI